MQSGPLVTLLEEGEIERRCEERGWPDGERFAVVLRDRLLETRVP